MKNTLLTLAALGTLSSLSARELMCEQCVPEPDCFEHLFVERCQFFITGEFLYWTAQEDALDYAVKSNTTPATTSVLPTGTYKTADYNWLPGVRASLSYYNCPKYWEVTLEYTWFDDRGIDRATSFLRPTRSTAAQGPFLSASSTIDLNYQLGDFYVARIFDPNSHLRLRIIGGLTAGYLDRDWKIEYTNNLLLSEQVKEDWRFWGGGLRMGLRADWFWGCEFYLTGKTTFATFIGTYKNTNTQTTPSTEAVRGNAKYDDHRFAMHAQFLLGPSWQRPCDCWSFELFAGYELNIWFNVSERIRGIPSNYDQSVETIYAQGLLGLQGLTVRLTIGF